MWSLVGGEICCGGAVLSERSRFFLLYRKWELAAISAMASELFMMHFLFLSPFPVVSSIGSVRSIAFVWIVTAWSFDEFYPLLVLTGIVLALFRSDVVAFSSLPPVVTSSTLFEARSSSILVMSGQDSDSGFDPDSDICRIVCGWHKSVPIPPQLDEGDSDDDDEILIDISITSNEIQVLCNTKLWLVTLSNF